MARIGDRIKAETVRSLREDTGKGMMEIRHDLERKHALQVVNADRELRPDIRAVLRWLVERS